MMKPQTLLIALALLLAPPVWAQAPAAAAEYAVKSALLYKLPRFIYLPNLQDGQALQLCVLGESPFGGALQKLAQTPIDGRKVAVQHPQNSKQALDCDLLFIARSEAAQLKTTLSALSQTAVVTISDIEGFAKAGGMLEMALDADGKGALSILINRKAAQAHGIQFNAQLLRLAKIVEP